MRRFTLVLGGVLACALVATAAGAPRPSARQARAVHHAATSFYRGEIDRLREETWHWQRVMGVEPTPATTRALAGLGPQHLRRLSRRWRERRDTARRHATHPPHLHGWLCIHRYEGSWSDTGAPYYGGLQMDLSFQRAYGAWLLRHKGTADHWTPLEQIWTAVRALRVRGFYPWPNTARLCGLL